MSVKRIDCCVETKPCEKPFPKLMRNRDTGGIAIFRRESVATMLCPGKTSNRGVGEPLTGIIIIPHDWEDYNEPLTLQNG